MTPAREGGYGGTPGKEREKKQIKPEQGVKRCPAPLRIQRPPSSPPSLGVGSGRAGPTRKGLTRSEILQPVKRPRRKEKVTSAVRPGGAQEGTAAAVGAPPIRPQHPPRGQTPARP